MTRLQGAALHARIFELVNQNKWEDAFFLIAKDVTKFEEISLPEHYSGPICGMNILQHACNIENDSEATEIVKRILDIPVIRDLSNSVQLVEFINDRGSSSSLTALEIALQNGHFQVIGELLNHPADVIQRYNGNQDSGQDGNVLGEIYKKRHQVLTQIFSKHITIQRDNEDDKNELLWELKWEFTPVIGVKSKDDKIDYELHETKLLTEVLAHPRVKQADILLHPLVQLFLYYKAQRFFRLILTSAVLHILWYLLCITYLVSRTRYLDMEANKHDSNRTENPVIKYLPDDSETLTALMHGLTMICFIVAFVKEIIEICICPTLSYYWKQYENFAQWFLLFCVLIAYISPDLCNVPFLQVPVYLFASVTNAFGIGTAILLTLTQVTKMKKFEYYDQLLLRSFKRFAKFISAISVTLFAFMYALALLLPDKPQFNVEYGSGFIKLFAMMTGEVNYDELFYPANKSSPMPHPITTKIVFFFYLISVIVLLQNLLIGLMVNDVEKLKRKYMASHLAARLEVIFLLETFLNLLGAKSAIKNRLVRKNPKASEDQPNTYKKNFIDLPKELQKAVLAEYKNYGL